MSKMIVFLALVFVAGPSFAIDPYLDIRISDQPPVRELDGSIKRDAKAIREFRKIWQCPSTNSHVGACTGWQVDHVIPLACGGVDAVWNMQWLPVDMKVRGKDRFERKIYGGNMVSKGCK